MSFFKIALFSIILGGCGTKTEMSEDRRTHNEDQHPAVTDGSKGALELHAPKKKSDDSAYYLEVSIRRSSECWSEGEEGTTGESVPPTDAEKSKTDSGLALQVASENNGPDRDIWPMPEPTPTPKCEPSYADTKKIVLGESEIVSFGGLEKGYYDIEVRLYDAEGAMIEEGYASAEVLPGQTSIASVQLYKTSGDGSLIVEILRGSDDAPPPVCGECEAPVSSNTKK